MTPLQAAQYLRMSTEHQQYSLDNQAAAIQRYAVDHGFDVIQTYCDAARSGVVLKRRTGLQKLLSDVVGGQAAFRAVLVYDVSRWGRFQDSDEAAHYEFLCKTAGIAVHYCAEQFANDGTIASSILKALKRTMAAEYSRELGVRVYEGQKRIATLGFKSGGKPGYGLRRVLVSADREVKQTLDDGERKSIATDRVTFVPGPSDEVECVRAVFRMLIDQGVCVYGIARELNSRGIKYVGGRVWDYGSVYRLLTNPKYSGCIVYGRTRQRLYAPTIKIPQSEWTLCRGAFQPIVDEQTFQTAQRILAGRTINKSNSEFLAALRDVLTRTGKLSSDIIESFSDVPSPSAYIHRFGSLRRAYELIGYGRQDFVRLDLRNRTMALRDELIRTIVSCFPTKVSVFKPGPRRRPRLKLPSGRTISVLISRAVRVWKETTAWQIDPPHDERRFVTLLARLNFQNTGFEDFYVLPNIDRTKRFNIRHSDKWLSRGIHLTDIQCFLEAVDSVRKNYG